MVKKELGPDALILSTKTVRNGKLGLLSKPMFEITAAIDTVDSHNLPRVAPQKKSDKSNFSFSIDPTPTFTLDKKLEPGFNQVVDDPIEQYLNNRPKQPQHYHQQQPQQEQQTEDALPETQKVAETSPRERHDDVLQHEVNELKNLVKGLAGQITQLSTEQESKVQKTYSPQQPVDNGVTNHFDLNIFKDDMILSKLIDRGINVNISRKIAGLLRQNFTDNDLSDPEKATSELIETIKIFLEVNPPVWKKDGTQQRIALVGPTGVGKTTTLAKIAASYLTNHSNSIALITIDTYRIAAVEQLKVYGEIMHLPVEVVISPDQLDSMIVKHSDKDLILIDTAGRSPKDSLCIDELSSFLRPELGIDKHLVVSAATRENELIDIIKRFNILEISNTIFTKLDECSNLGVLLNVQTQNKNPLSYVTNGQRVPEDLLEITPRSLAELIMSQHEGSTHE